MKLIVLDTDHLTFFERADGAESLRLRARLEQVDPSERATTIISYEEQTRGWFAYMAQARSQVQLVNANGRLLRHLDVFRNIRVLGFDERAATEYQRLQRARLGVKTMDLQNCRDCAGESGDLIDEKSGAFPACPWSAI